MIVEVTLTVEQRIRIIQLTDKNFNILDIGIGPVDLHQWIDDNYPEIPRTADVFVINNK
jgi:hypothetical protein